jgi:hypoxanthine phosphoribosyltransferase
MPPKKLPKRMGNPVFDPAPTPTMKNPMTMKIPKNGVVILPGRLVVRGLCERGALLRRQHVVLRDDIHDTRQALVYARGVVVVAKVRKKFVRMISTSQTAVVPRGSH